MSSSNAGVDRATSVSSRRRMNVPPTCRAKRKLKSAVRAVPMWSGPVGLGAIRTRTGVMVAIVRAPRAAPSAAHPLRAPGP